LPIFFKTVFKDVHTMAKTNKKAAKPAKKKAAPAPKAKKVAPAKKVVAKKEKEVKKVVAKKVAPAPKKEKEAPKPVMKKAAVDVTKKVVPLTKRQEAMAKPLSSPQLNIFPILTQRPIAHKPSKGTAPQDDRTRYSDEELKEFETLIMKKLDKAREEFRILKETLNRNNDAGTDATSGGNTKVLEDGAETAEKENLSQLAARQQKYIMNLENALVRIKNHTYGICTVTGKLIPKERLIAVPHTTQSIEAKMMQTD
jgi:RNA polymerase-binding transcription factor DksA